MIEEQNTPGLQTEAEKPKPDQEQASKAEGGKEKIEGDFKARFNALVNAAKGLIYGDGFEGYTKLVQQNGKKGFADAMGIIVLGVLDELEKRYGKQEEKLLAVVAVTIVAMLATDAGETGLVPDLDAEDVTLAVSMVVGKWMDNNPDRGKMPAALQALQQEAQKQPQGQPNQMAQQPQQTGFAGGVG